MVPQRLGRGVEAEDRHGSATLWCEDNRLSCDGAETFHEGRDVGEGGGVADFTWINVEAELALTEEVAVKPNAPDLDSEQCRTVPTERQSLSGALGKRPGLAIDGEV